MNTQPETYEELIRQKRCVDLLKYYTIPKETLEEIYKFLSENENGYIEGSTSILTGTIPGNPNKRFFSSTLYNHTIDGLYLSNKEFKIYPHYEVSYSSGGGYSGGSSSNNNNNNNNNNDNNNNMSKQRNSGDDNGKDSEGMSLDGNDRSDENQKTLDEREILKSMKHRISDDNKS